MTDTAEANYGPNLAAATISDEAIIRGLKKAGADWTDDAIAYIRFAIGQNFYVSDDADAELFAQALRHYGTRDVVASLLDDVADSEEVQDITGCTTGNELIDLYLGKPSVDVYDLYEVYYGDSEADPETGIIFVLDVI